MNSKRFSDFLLGLSPDKVYEAIEREAIIEYDGNMDRENSEIETMKEFKK